MRYAYATSDVRAIEERAQRELAPGVLMQRASFGVATIAIRLLQNALGLVLGAKVLLLIGSGDNGGDALYAGAYLAERGADVTALLLGSSAHEGGLAALQQANGEILNSMDGIDFAQVDLVIDGIIGIGGHGGLRPDAAAVLSSLSEDSIVLSVDIPSGVDADTGEMSGAHVSADVTAVCGVLKAAHVIDPGASASGVCEVVDLDLDFSEVFTKIEIWQGSDVRDALPRAEGTVDKYRRGVLGVVAGSTEYPGAGALVCAGALATGVGMIRYLGGASEAVIGEHPEVVRTNGRVQAWVIGPGLVDAVMTDEIALAIGSDQPLIVDAGALSLLPSGRADTLITPHAGELAALLGVDRLEVERSSLHFAKLAAFTFDVMVLLKGATTVIVSPTGRIAVNPTGTPELATAGSGDVLAGAIGALAASGVGLFEAAVIGTWIHGLAGRLMHGGGASEIAGTIPDAIAALSWQAYQL